MFDFADVTPRRVTLTSLQPYDRGLERGKACAAEVAGCWDVYRRLFEVNGIAENDVRREALSTLAAVDAWAPFLAEEMRGTAEGAGLGEWQVAALSARTEILSMSRAARPGECSTVIHAETPVFSAQTWDWHDELAGFWHLQEVDTTAGGFVGLTEYGILGKIGVNRAGVGVHLNVLGHRQDTPGAVPVHLAAAHVLHTARSLVEAVAILVDAPVRTSSAISVVTEEGAATVELSPVGAAVVRPTPGGTESASLLHTNHFLDERLAAGEKTELYQPDSQQRIDLLERRCRERFQPESSWDLVDYLCSFPGDGAELCCVPDPTATLGGRWATLATALLQPGERTMRVSPGTPAMAIPDTWISLTCR